MSLVSRFRNSPSRQRFGSLEALAEQVQYMGNTYPLGLRPSLAQPGHEVSDGFEDYARHAFANGGPIFALVLARAMLFSDIRFVWQRFKGGQAAETFGHPSLSILERPWPRGTTGDLLWRAEQDASIAGNFYAYSDGSRIWRLRPDRCTIVAGSRSQVTAKDSTHIPHDLEFVGLIYRERPDAVAVTFLPNEIVHWAPIPDPLSSFRGMSWMTPILREVSADRGAIIHKNKFFEQGATPSIVITPDASVNYDEFKEFADDFRDQHEGALNAYKTLILGGGSSVQTVGVDFKAMDFRGLQGIAETRMAAAAGVPPIIAGFSEGLATATYANYGAARRKFGDHFARPQWRSFCSSIEHLLPNPPAGANKRLW